MRKFFFALAIILSGCVTDRNFNQSNVCDIFKTNPQWKSYAEKTKEKWGVPVSLQLSFIKQESSFNATGFGAVATATDLPSTKSCLDVPTRCSVQSFR